MKKDKPYIHWIDRELIRLQVYYCLCLDESTYKKEMGRLGIDYPDQFVINKAAATTHTLEHKEHGVCCVVTMHNFEHRTLIETYALLQHEAVHVWQEHCRKMGERNPSPEFEAYGIQRIGLDLMHEFNKYLREHKTLRAKLLKTV